MNMTETDTFLVVTIDGVLQSAYNQSLFEHYKATLTADDTTTMFLVSSCFRALLFVRGNELLR